MALYFPFRLPLLDEYRGLLRIEDEPNFQCDSLAFLYFLADLNKMS